MRFFGVDIGGEDHFAAAIDESGRTLVKPFRFGEQASGYSRLLERLGSTADAFIVMEATGHYWKNLFAFLHTHGFSVCVVNPLRTRRFAQEDLERTKTDSIDALGLARFGAQKRPKPTPMPDALTDQVRELVRFRDRLVQKLGDDLRQLHRLVDLCFPEFIKVVKNLGSDKALAILKAYPTSKAMARADVKTLSELVYDGRHKVGEELASELRAAAATSIGRHAGVAYEMQVEIMCSNSIALKANIRQVESQIDATMDDHELGGLLTSIDGISTHTAARIIGEVGDLRQFASADAFASYVAAIPGIRQSGARQPQRAGLTPIGNAKLRSALWMPTLTGVRRNPWLKATYERLLAHGKPKKVALVACLRKLLIAIYWVAMHRKPFEPKLAS